MTEKVLDKLEEAFSWGCSDVEACLHADISVDALYKYIKKNPRFGIHKESLKKRPTLTARRTVVASLPEDNDMALKYLERKEKREFSLRQETEIANREGEAFQVEQEITIANVDDFLNSILLNAQTVSKGTTGK